MSDIEIRWRNGEKWVEYPVDTILSQPLRHVCHLFGVDLSDDGSWVLSSTCIRFPVVAKQSGTYIVNTGELLKYYRVKRNRAKTFLDVFLKAGGNLDKPLREVGFL